MTSGTPMHPPLPPAPRSALRRGSTPRSTVAAAAAAEVVGAATSRAERRGSSRSGSVGRGDPLKISSGSGRPRGSSVVKSAGASAPAVSTVAKGSGGAEGHWPHESSANSCRGEAKEDVLHGGDDDGSLMCALIVRVLGLTAKLTAHLEPSGAATSGRVATTAAEKLRSGGLKVIAENRSRRLRDFLVDFILTWARKSDASDAKLTSCRGGSSLRTRCSFWASYKLDRENSKERPQAAPNSRAQLLGGAPQKQSDRHSYRRHTGSSPARPRIPSAGRRNRSGSPVSSAKLPAERVSRQSQPAASGVQAGGAEASPAQRSESLPALRRPREEEGAALPARGVGGVRGSLRSQLREASANSSHPTLREFSSSRPGSAASSRTPIKATGGGSGFSPFVHGSTQDDRKHVGHSFRPESGTRSRQNGKRQDAADGLGGRPSTTLLGRIGSLTRSPDPPPKVDAMRRAIASRPTSVEDLEVHPRPPPSDATTLGAGAGAGSAASASQQGSVAASALPARAPPLAGSVKNRALMRRSHDTMARADSGRVGQVSATSIWQPREGSDSVRTSLFSQSSSAGAGDAKLIEAARSIYFAECERLQIMPHVPRFLTDAAAADSLGLPPTASSGKGKGKQQRRPPLSLDLSAAHMRDRDLEALIEPLNMLNPATMDVDMSQNDLTDLRVARFIKDVRCRDIRRIDLSISGASACAMSELSFRMQQDWTRLRELRIRGCTLADGAWEAFGTALVERVDGSQLVELDVAETGLGRSSQRSVQYIARLLAESRFLERVSLAGNFIFLEGFAALADAVRETTTLRKLDVSHNSLTHMAVQKKQALAVPGLDPELCFNPVALLCEALHDNVSLRELCLVASSLDYTADWSLLVGLAGNSTLEVLDLRQNPHGEEGLRTILRFVMDPRRRMCFCDIADFRECGPWVGTVPVSFLAPTGRYELNLGHPQHRAVARWLLDTAGGLGGDGAVPRAFSNVIWTPSPCPAGELTQAAWCWRLGVGEHGLGVATSGKLVFDVKFDTDISDEPSAGAAVQRWMSRRRFPLTLGRFVTLLAMFDSLPTALQKEQLLRVVADTLLLKWNHLVRLLQSCHEVRDEALRTLYGCLTDHSPLLIFDLQEKGRKVSSGRLRYETAARVFFSANLPTNRYNLDLRRPSARRVAELLQVVNQYESETARRRGDIDVSQHGNYEGARNFTWGSQPHESLTLFTVASHGIVHLDYASPPHCSPGRAAPPTADAALGALLATLADSPCCSEDRVVVLRTVAHHLALSTAQLRQVCEAFPAAAPAAPEGQGSRSAFQFTFDNLRVEAFVALFGRCLDPPAACTVSCLYDPQFLSAAGTADVRARLGYCRTFDALHCCEEHPILAVPQAKLRGMGRCSSRGSARSTAASVATPDSGCRYSLRLYVHDECQVARFLVTLAEKERGVNIINCQWSERDAFVDRGYTWCVPSEWLEEMPRVGVFECTYYIEKAPWINQDSRRSLAERFCGWEPVGQPLGAECIDTPRDG